MHTVDKEPRVRSFDHSAAFPGDIQGNSRAHLVHMGQELPNFSQEQVTKTVAQTVWESSGVGMHVALRV